MIRIRLCIPSYRSPLILEQVLVDCLRETDLPILVMDGGSDLTVRSLVRHKEIELCIRTGRLQILSALENRSKGSAVQAAIAESARRGFTHLLTMDADGANVIREVAVLAAASDKNPPDVILANRAGVGTDGRSNNRSRRRFTDFLVQYETKMRIRDPGSGFRIYPLVHVQGMRFRGKGPDFEIEALIRLLWKNVTLREVDTVVCFTEPEMYATGWRRVAQDLRLSILHTVLAIVCVLKTHRTPAEVGAAVGTGVFVGCTPFFGFHTLLAVALSFLFRLNFVYVWLGTQVSNPFLAGFLTVASIGVGRHIIKTPAHTVAGFSLQWLAGSMFVGTVLGIVSGVASYLVARNIAKNVHDDLPQNAELADG